MTAVVLKTFDRIQTQDFDLSLFDALNNFPACGGTAVFIGSVRNHHQGRDVTGLEYTAYAPIAEKMIRAIEQEVCEKYGIDYVRVVHRIGRLSISATAIIAVAYAPHRREAFAACEEAVERVKHEVPVWKEEFYSDGSSQFVSGCCIRKDLVEPENVNTVQPHSHTHANQHTHHNQHHDHHHDHHHIDHSGCSHNSKT